jgi:hypothetical protein
MTSKLLIVSNEGLHLCSGKVNVSLLAEAANNVNLRLRNAVASTGKVRLDLYEIIDLSVKQR